MSFSETSFNNQWNNNNDNNDAIKIKNAIHAILCIYRLPFRTFLSCNVCEYNLNSMILDKEAYDMKAKVYLLRFISKSWEVYLTFESEK